MISASTATRVVTPSTEGVLDDLKCTALVLEIDGSTLVLCDVEILLVTAEIAQDVKDRLQAAYGVDPDLVTIAATHTHAGPEMRSERLPVDEETSDDSFWEEYEKFLKDVIYKTISDCFEKGLTPVQAIYRTVEIEGVYGNRNGIGKPEDKDVTLIEFHGKGGVQGAIVNISCHPTVLGAQNLQISGDLLGYISRGVKERVGVFPVMMQGASGDMSNRNYRLGHDAAELRRSGEAILEQLFASSQMEPLHLQQPQVEKYNYHETYRLDTEALSTLRQQLVAQIEAETEYDKHKMLQSSLYAVDVKLKNPEIEANFDATILRVGDVEICKHAGEMFSRFGKQIKAASKARLPLIWGYCGGYSGYMADKDEYGVTYESLMSPLPKGATEKITQDLSDLIAGEKE